MKKKIFLLSVLLATMGVFAFSVAMANTDVNLADLSPPTSIANDAMAAQGSGAVVTQLVNDATVVSSTNTWAIAGTPMEMKSGTDIMNANTAKKVLVWSQTEARRLAPYSDVTNVAGYEETSLNNAIVNNTNSGAQDRASPVTNLINTGPATITKPHTYAYMKMDMTQMTNDKVPIAGFQQINIGMTSSNAAKVSQNSPITEEDSGLGRASPYSLNSKNGQTELCALSGIYFSSPPTIASTHNGKNTESENAIAAINPGGLHGGPSSPLIAVAGQHDYPNPFNA